MTTKTRTLKVEAKAVDKSSSVFSKIGASAISLNQGLMLLQKTAGLITGSFSRVAGLASKAADEQDRMFVASQRIGTSAQFFSRMEFAAKQAGNTSAELATGLTALTRRASAMPKTFQRWGISVRDANGNIKDTETLALDVANRVAGMSSAAERAALAQDLMSESGRKLVPLLASGADGLQRMFEESDRLGVTIDQTSARIGNEFNNQLGAMQDSLAGTSRIIGSQFTPLLTVAFTRVKEVAQAVTLWAKANQAAIQGGITDFIEWIAEVGMPAVGTATELVSKAWNGWKMLISGLKLVFNTFWQKNLEAIDAMLASIQRVARIFNQDLATAIGGAREKVQDFMSIFAGSAQEANKELVEQNNQIKRNSNQIASYVHRGSAGLRQLSVDAANLTQNMSAAAGGDLAAGGGSGSGSGSGGGRKAFARGSAAARVRAQTEKEAAAATVDFSQALRTGAGAAKGFISALRGGSASGVASAALSAVGGVVSLIPGGQVAGGALSAIGSLLGSKGGVASKRGFVRMARGGVLSGGIAGRDSIPAMLMPGEGVLPTDLTTQLRAALAVPGGGAALGGGGTNIVVNAPMEMASVPPTGAQLQRHVRDSVNPAIRHAFSRTSGSRRVTGRR